MAMEMKMPMKIYFALILSVILVFLVAVIDSQRRSIQQESNWQRMADGEDKGSRAERKVQLLLERPKLHTHVSWDGSSGRLYNLYTEYEAGHGKIYIEGWV
jgi:hypothetical protein